MILGNTRNLTLLLTSITLVACSIAPLNTPTTAKTLGQNHSSFNANLPLGVSIAYGLSDNTDIEGSLELQFLQIVNSVAVKQALYSNEKLFLSAFGGFFYSKSEYYKSEGYFLGPIMSFPLATTAELYLSAKYNQVNWTGLNPDEVNDTDLLFTVFKDGNNTHFEYTQWDLGLRFKASKRVFLSIGAKHLLGVSAVGLGINVVN